MVAPRRASGRKQSIERIRELVAILGSLSEEGDRITLDGISGRLGVSQDEAASMMSIVCQASGEDFGGLLISANDSFTEFTLQYPGVRGRPIRLTTSETIALSFALDMASIGTDDPLRLKLRTAFSSDDVNEQEVKRALGAPIDPDIQRSLFCCARAQAESRMLSFMYKGLADENPRQRCAIVRHIRRTDARWYVEAHDLDQLADRVFRLDRMSCIAIGPHGRLPQEDLAAASSHLVKVRFTDPSYLTIFEWPGLKISKRTQRFVEGTLVYYGPSSDWLIRRIIACRGALQVEDERIMHSVTEYARSLLSP